MDRQFRTRLLILAALAVLLPVIVLVSRLGVMAIADHEEYSRRAEATRARTELLFPTRARILDAKGVVLADSESVWDLTLDVYELTHPRHVLARALASPEIYPPLAEVEAFHRDLVLPALEREFAPPTRARRFLELWKLRQHPVALHDRNVVTEQVARLAGIDSAQVAQRIAAVETEIDALIAEVGSPDNAAPRSIQRAFVHAMDASRDPEYWERIRRFPKSLALEPVLRRRIANLGELLARCESLAEVAGSASVDPGRMAAELRTASEQVSELEHALSTELGRSGQVGSVNAIGIQLTAAATGDADRDVISPEAALIQEDLNAARRWLDVLGVAAGSPDARAHLRREAALLDGTAGEIADLETRLGRLVEKLIKPNLAAWESRWPGLLERLRGLAPLDAEPGRAAFTNPLLLARKIDRPVVEALKSHRHLVGGVMCEARSVRRYPLGGVAQSLVGSVRLPDGDALDERVLLTARLPAMAPLLEQWFDGDESRFGPAFAGTLARQPVGITGVEGFHEFRLAGTPGARAVHVDARGIERSLEGEWHPQAAGDLRLTLDAGLMEFAAATVRSWEPKLRARALTRFRETWDEVGDDAWALRGSLIVIDTETGAVVVMLDIDDELTGRAAREAAANVTSGATVASPTVTSNPPSWRWMEPASSLPRSAGGQYEPGSVFKILTAIAMLEDGVVTASSSFDDVRHDYRIGSETMRTSHFAGSGIRITDALCRSSNGYFWHFSTKMGGGSANRGLEDCLLPWARRFGFGERPGLDAAGLQAAGRLPRPGRVDDPPELARNTIGQGAMTASPLQVARFLAAVASKGRLCTPHISSEPGPAPVQIAVSEKTWDLVHRGMYECIHTGHGTASKSRVLRRISAAGKTGTAQTGHFWSRDAWARRQAGEKGVQPELRKPDHAWFGGFAPASKPKYAFVMLAEFSGLSGGDVADCVGEVVEAALNGRNGAPGTGAVLVR